MSVFLKNNCQFPSCRKNYYSLSDLIRHIESEHLDFDPYKIEQLEEEKPDSLPLSYVLKYSGPNDSPPQMLETEVTFLNEAVIHELDDVTANEVVTAFNNNYLSCDDKEIPERRVRFEARLNLDEIPQTYGGNKLFTMDYGHKKPFLCTMKDCDKRYKNINGIKYHYKKHHKMLIPNLKKSLLKSKIGLKAAKLDKHTFHGFPAYNYHPPEIVYPQQFEDSEGVANEYFYSMPTSNSTQVPLHNMSFNYYNVEGDAEDFSGKNSGYYVSSFDKY